MKGFLTATIFFFFLSCFAQAQYWSGTANTTSDINRDGNVGFGVSSPNFQIDIDKRIGINGTQILYLPDQTNFNGTMIFSNAGSSLSSGDATNNTFVGLDAGLQNTTGASNMLLGYRSGFANKTGNSNVFIGRTAGFYNNSGSHNIFLGTASGFNNASGNQNVFIGTLSGYDITNGENNVCIGYSAGRANNVSYSILIGHSAGNLESNSSRLYIENSSSSAPLIYGEFDNDILGFNGQVGIGTQTPGSYALYVTGTTNKDAYFDGDVNINGNITSEEVLVQASVTPDFVFEDDYDLKSLEEVESFISEKGHLPEIPSAKEMKENGISVGEMQGLLLQKIEELTLHMIQQQKTIKELKKENEEIIKKLEADKKEISE